MRNFDNFRMRAADYELKLTINDLNDTYLRKAFIESEANRKLPRIIRSNLRSATSLT